MSFIAAAGKFPSARQRRSIWCFEPPRLSRRRGPPPSLLPWRRRWRSACADLAELPDPTADLYPAKRNETYTLDRPITDEKINGNYNNFYEFGTRQERRRAGAALQIRPWTVKIDGMVEKPMEIGIDDLIRKMTLEERTLSPPLRRSLEHGDCRGPDFPFAKLVELRASRSARRNSCAWKPSWIRSSRARPAAALVSVALHRRADDGGSDQRTRLPRHRRLRPSAGQAARRAAAAGGAVEIRLQVDQVDRALQLRRQAAEVGMWEELQPSEYGFWANVNPQVPHPRWSQASEEVIGTGERRPTLLFNGYGEYVAGLYKGLEQEPLWM